MKLDLQYRSFNYRDFKLDNFLLVVAAFLLVLLNGFFVAAEFGLVKLRQTRVRSMARSNGLRGRLLATVHQHLDTYLSACQLGITLASLGLGWIGEPAFARLLFPLFDLLNITSPEVVHAVSFFSAFFIISYLHIVVGELAPKSMAIRRSEKVALWTAPALYAFYWLMYPAIWVLNASSNKLLHWIGLDVIHNGDSYYTAEEIRLILRGSGSYSSSTKKVRDGWNTMVQVLDFGSLEIADLMRPISEVVGIHKNASMEESLATIARNRFSRYPYFDIDEKTVLGIVHLKDLFLAEQEGKKLEFEAHLRQAEFVAPTTPAAELFARFKKGAPHFALVGYKGSTPLGFLTLDNLLSALLGQIRDEFRENENDWTLLDDGTLIGKGSLPLYTLGTALGIELDSDEVESIGGLIMQQLGDLPVEGQRIEFAQFYAVVDKMDGPRMVSVRVQPKQV